MARTRKKNQSGSRDFSALTELSGVYPTLIDERESMLISSMGVARGWR